MIDVTRPRPELYQSGGTLPLGMPTYVEREADHRLFAALREHQYCYVLTARQMGKSSLIVRTQQRLKEHGISSVLIDLTVMGKGATQQQWYYGHADEIAQALKLTVAWESWWTAQSELSDVQRFGRFLTDFVLSAVGGELVVFIDEIDSTIGLSYGDDYFALIRALYNRRAQDARLMGLTFVLVGVAAPADLIKDAQRTPFNIGHRIDLTDFTLAEAAPLLQGLAPEPELAQRLLQRVFDWTGGHPYLTQRTCIAVATWAESSWDATHVPGIVDLSVKEIFFAAGKRNTDSNLQVVSTRLAGQSDNGVSDALLALYRRVLRGERVGDDDRDPVRIALKLSGLVVSDTGGLRVRNQIYATVFDQSWVDNLSGASSPTPTADDPQHDVFVSYSANDRDWVAGVLVPALESSGLVVASDLQLLPGANWQAELSRMRETSRFFVPVLSPDWVRSRGAQEEFALMSSRVGILVPVLLRPTELPAVLREIQFADFSNPQRQAQAMEQLLRVLGGKPTTAELRFATPASPSVTTAHDGDADLALRLPNRFTRDQLLELAATRFPLALDRVALDTPHAEVAARLVDEAARHGRLAELRDAVEAGAVPPSSDMPESTDSSTQVSTRPIAFVLIPFGIKEGSDHHTIDFELLYRDLLRPALVDAGFAPMRYEQSMRGGDVGGSSMQLVALADLLVADVSIANANIWYLLGLRHSLRKGGVLLIHDASWQVARQPFDIYTDRRWVYQSDRPERYVSLVDELKRVIAVWRGAGHNESPVYQFFPMLQEPSWTDLVAASDRTEIAESIDELRRRISVAKRSGRAQDLLMWASEAPLDPLRVEALQEAGAVLLQHGLVKLALEQYDAILSGSSPDNPHAVLGKARCLALLERFDEALDLCRGLVRSQPDGAEFQITCGKIQQAAWLAGDQKDAARLQAAIDHFEQASRGGPDMLRRAGFPELMLLHLQQLVGRRSKTALSPVSQMRIQALEGGVRWALAHDDPRDERSAFMSAELTLLSAPVAGITTAYRRAIARSRQNRSVLDAAQAQLKVLSQAGFRPVAVAAAMDVIRQAQDALPPADPATGARRTFLFFGHMLDFSKTAPRRFPVAVQHGVATAIDRYLCDANADSTSMGVSSACHGGDLMFAEACVKRNMRAELLLPMEETAFVSRFVASAGDDWRKRYYALKASPLVAVRTQPRELGRTPGPPGSDAAWLRNTAWLLRSALVRGPEACELLLVWSGREPVGHVGTTVQEFERRTGRKPTRIDPMALLSIAS